MNVPYGNCHCGCGEKTTLSTQTYTKLGYKKGDPMKYRCGHSNRKSAKEYLVNKETECWEWQRGKLSSGYGLIYPNRKNQLAHRYYYEKHIGTIPDGLYVMHTCDNTSCVNPQHLTVGTAKDNMQDAKRKMRLKGMKNARYRLLKSLIM